MWRIDYIFYRICDFYKKKRDNSAEQTSMAIISLVETAIVLDIFMIFDALFNLIQYGDKTKYLILPVYFGFTIFNWRKYLKPRRYRTLRLRWKNEEIEMRKRNGIYVLLAIVIPMTLPILNGIVKHNILGNNSFW